MDTDREATAFEIIWRSVWVRAAVYILLIVGVIWMLWRLRYGYAFALQVAIIAYVIAYILNPIVAGLQRLRVARPLAVIVVYFMLILAFLFGSVLVGRVIVEAGEFVRLIPRGVDNLLIYAERTVQWFDTLPPAILEYFSTDPAEPGLADELIATARESITEFFSQVAISLRTTLQGLVTGSGTFIYVGVVTIISGTFQVFLIILASAYFLYDFPRISASFKRYVPLRWRPLYLDISHKADVAVGGFLRGQLLISLCIGIFLWIGLSLLGVPLATSISFLAAILNLIPYLGPILGAIPAALLGLTVSPWIALGTLGVFVAANLLESQLFGPLIMARSTNLHPVTVLLSLLVGAGLFGLIGMLLVIPLVALVKVILEEYLLTRPAYRGQLLGASELLTEPPEPPVLEKKPRLDM